MFDSCGLAAVWDNNKPILPSKVNFKLFFESFSTLITPMSS